MINKIIAFSIQNKLVVGLLVLALVGVGLYSMATINLGAQPDITNNQVQVITQSPNLATEDIEQFVTYPVELAMANLPGVTEIRSVSRFGLSVVTIVFKDEMGTYLPRQLISEKLNEVKAEIPEQFGSPAMGPITTGLGEIYQYTLKPEKGYEDKYSPTELRTIQDWIVKRQLALTEGVVEVNAFGGKIKQYEIAIDPARLNAMEVTMTEVFDALQENNVNTGGAYIEKNKMANFIRGEGLARSLDDIRQIVIKNENGLPVLIKDVAEKVDFGNQVRYGAFTQDGHEAVGGMVLMLRGDNPNSVVNTVRERIKEVQKSLPEGLKIVPFLDRSELIGRTTATIEKNLIEGALIVIFVLVLLLGSFRGGLVTASLIPLSLLFAFILMKAFGVWANLMSLGAIDFGIIVDGAVIIVEGTVHEIEKRIKAGKKKFDQPQMDKVVYEASSTVMNSAFFGQIIILIVFTPILFLTGIEGKMFRPMAFTFGFAVLGAIILCLTYVPMITSLTMKPVSNKRNWFHKVEGKISGFSNGMMNRINNGYRPVLLKSLSHRMIILIVAVILLVGAGFTFSKMGGEFIPSIDEGDIAMQALLRPGSSLSESIETSKEIENIVLDNFPEVKTMVARIGVADIPTDPMPMDIADTYIILDKNKENWTSAETKEKLIEKIKEELAVVPGVNFVFSQPVELRFNELLTGVREDVAIKLYGEDLDVLSQKAAKMANIIKTIPGAGDVNLEATSGLPQMTVRFNRRKVAQYGLNIQKLNRYISTAFAGGTAGVIFEGEKRFDMVVRLDKEHRRDIRDLKNLLIDLPGGNQIPVKEVAEISYQPGPMQISRDNTSRRIYVGVNVRGRDVESMVNDIQAKLDAELDLPPGYHIEYGGAFENLQRAKERLTIVVPIALALIFLLLYFALGSILQSVMIYMAVPLAAIGGIFALALRGMPFSISAGVGFIVLFGVAVLNGLVLISRLNSLKEEGVTDIRERILMGTQERIRPIFLTALAAIMGFFPMALSHGAGASVQRPLATVVIGGLITATLLSLIIVPILYSIVENSGKNKNGISDNFTINPAFIALALGIGAMAFPTNLNAQTQDKFHQNFIEQDSLKVDQDFTPISLRQAVQKAKASYPGIKAAKLEIKSQEALEKTAWDFGTTQIFTGGEELPDNGTANEGIYTTIGIQQQNIEVFSIGAKNKLQNQKVALSKAVLDLTSLQVEREVSKAWGNAYTSRRKYQLYVKLDSIFSDFERAARIRFETEASSKLEYLAAVNQARQVSLQKMQVYRDYMANLQKLNLWLASGGPYTVAEADVDKIDTPVMQRQESLSNHPAITYYQQQKEVANARRNLNTKAFFPKLNAQYGRQKIAGQDGFFNFQVGISIPLFFAPELGQLQSSKIKNQIAEQNLREKQLQVNSKYQDLKQQYLKWLESWQYYQQEALPLAKEQRNGAVFAYKEGGIDYTTFLQSVRDAIAIESQSWDALNNYLQSKYELEFFLNSAKQ
ncbi:CusA/CzcA family heavy metal efflux RND transporter [Zunongwangia sp. H14]|uniref:CusA/CzcA family heavy metal efflux RND transporter n=1 Tax=Zunongwangia sp. H14 TaxID=3240792 RepID=UPI003569B64F